MTEQYRGEEPERIALWFMPTQTPEGGAPEEIREQWIGVPLPVRESKVVDEANTVGGYAVGGNIFNPTEVHVREVLDTVSVGCEDAFKALRLNGRTDAAQWWEDWFNSRSWMFGSTLMFRSSEGRIMTPDEVEQELPGATAFDEQEI